MTVPLPPPLPFDIALRAQLSSPLRRRGHG
jgi:hypothetical protein